jgi:TPP-dependent pyruvate/acetoin dehydrogenase alpha subunit
MIDRELKQNMSEEQKIIAKEILRLRFAQMIINEEYKNGKFKIPIHLAFGHESIAVALSHVMKNQDKLVLSHRNVAYNLAREKSIKPILDEYFLKPTGIMGGKVGSMNLINPTRGIIYSSSILGNNFSVGAGIALAQKMWDMNGITIILGGDGAMEEGSFHESLIMCKTLKLSVLIIIENNEWSMSTKINERRIPINISKLTESFQIKYVKLSGNDPFVYIKELEELREYSLREKTPVCIEIMVNTLGDWRMKTPEQPDGKFINYHAGPTPSVDLNSWPNPLRENEDDPVFVLTKYFDKDTLLSMSRSIKEGLENEIH